MDGLGSKWRVHGVELNGPKDAKWTVLKSKSERSLGMKLDGLKGSKLA